MANILVVEDDETYSQLLSNKFQQTGHQVQIASNGQQALEHIQSNHTTYDLVILDLLMPHMDGNTFLNNLNINIPVIVLTSQDQSSFPQSVIATLKKSDTTLEQIIEISKKHLYS